MNTFRKILFLFFGFISFISLPSTLLATPLSSEDALSQKILFHINAYRKSRGLKPLVMNKAISKEAARHSANMASGRLSFGHQDFMKRIKRLYRKIPEANGGAENIAFNYKDPEDLVRRWVKSPGHRKNIEGSYSLTGIGIAYDKKDRPYYTELFLRTK